MAKRPFLFDLLLVMACSAISGPLAAREWKSGNGHYTVEADLISFSQQLVVLKKKKDGGLVAVELKELSEADQSFVRSKEAAQEVKKSADKMQTWTSVDGMKVRGRVLAYGRKSVAIERKSSKVYVNDKLFADIEALRQKVILKTISKLEDVQLEDEKQLTEWAKKLRGAPKNYLLEGVMMELESGDQIGVPFFMFSPQDGEVLRPGWERWLESEEKADYRAEESFLVRSAAMAYQQDRKSKKQIEMLKLNLLGAATGIVNIWEVGLRPGPRTRGRPMSVLVSAQNSGQATQIALRQHPGYQIYGVRKASN